MSKDEWSRIYTLISLSVGQRTNKLRCKGLCSLHRIKTQRIWDALGLLPEAFINKILAQTQ